MYLLILFLVPFLYLFNSYLALAGLMAAIIAMYVSRTRPSSQRGPKRAAKSPFTAGYED